jgi:hypothetical protein
MRALKAERRQVLPPLGTARQADHRDSERFGVEPIDLLDRPSGDLRQRRNVTGDDRCAARHGFDDGQAEALVDRREHEHLGKAVQRRQVLERHIAGEADRVLDLQPLDQLLDVAAQPPVGTGAHELMRQLAALPAPREALDQLRQVLARLDRADVQNEAVRQVVPVPDALALMCVVDGPERRRGRFVHDVHAFGRQPVETDDVALGALRYRDDRVGAPRREIDERAVQEHAPGRVIPRVQRKAHVVDRHDRRDAGCQRHHAVREVHDIGFEVSEQARGQRLHPHHPRRAPRRRRDAHARRQRPGRVDRPVRHDDKLVVRRLPGEMMQQVFGVVAHTGPPRAKRRAVKCDAHAKDHKPRNPQNRQTG